MSDISSIQKRERSWCFTLNNPESEERRRLNDLVANEQITYMCFGEEEGDEKEVPHLQGFIYFVNKKSLTQLKKLLGRAHWEVKKGSYQQAKSYCKKDGDWFEWGELPMSPAYNYYK